VGAKSGWLRGEGAGGAVYAGKKPCLWSITRNMSEKYSTPDQRIAWFANGQHGVITTAQLYRCRIDDDGIGYRRRIRRLHRLHQGVYSVGHGALSNEGKWMAAVLACGEGAVLSHRSAAQLFALLPAAVGTVHVTVPFERRPSRADVAIHRSRTLTPAAITARDRIPATKPWRTSHDLRRTEPPEVVREAIRQADFHGFPLDDISTDRTRSELERMFLALCRRYGLPVPEVNVRIGRYLVDFLFREAGLAVEVDGWQAHRGHQAFEDDRARGLDLLKRGYELLRLSYRQIEHEPAVVAAVLHDRLNRAAA